MSGLLGPHPRLDDDSSPSHLIDSAPFSAACLNSESDTHIRDAETSQGSDSQAPQGKTEGWGVIGGQDSPSK